MEGNQMIKPWADQVLDNEVKDATVAMLAEIDALREVLGDLPKSQVEMLQEIKKLRAELSKVTDELFALSQDDGKIERALDRADAEIKKLRAELDSEKLYSKQAMHAVDEIATKCYDAQPSSFDILAITTAYEQGVGKGHQSHGLGVEIENPYVPSSCFEAWSLGYAEGKQQAAPKVPHGIKGESL
jgi:predicted RNase H-like nuclease (RuvC/YqgF family)